MRRQIWRDVHSTTRQMASLCEGIRLYLRLRRFCPFCEAISESPWSTAEGGTRGCQYGGGDGTLPSEKNPPFSSSSPNNSNFSLRRNTFDSARFGRRPPGWKQRAGTVQPNLGSAPSKLGLLQRSHDWRLVWKPHPDLPPRTTIHKAPISL